MNKAAWKDLLQAEQGGPQSPLPPSASSRREIWIVGLLCLVLLTPLYLGTAAPTVGLGHDTGELTTCCIIQGVPHSPGYPLFTAMGWMAVQLLPGLEPAHAINLLCGLEVGLAMAFLGAALSLTVRPLPALSATLITGTSAAVWRQAVVTEVFALHLLLMCTLIWLAMLWQRAETRQRREILLATSFIVGCGLAHQHIMALAAPPFLLFGALTKGRGRPWGFSWWNLPVFLAAWLLPYGVQMECARQLPALNWESPTTPALMIDHFLRRSYGTGVLNPASLTYDSRAGDAQVTAYMLGLIRSQFPFPCFLFLILALDRLCMGRFQPHLALFAALTVLYGPFFAFLGNQPTQEFYGDLMERFYSCSVVSAAGLLACGIAYALELRPEIRRYAPLILALPLYTAWLNAPKCSQRGTYLGLDLLRTQIRQLPPRSILIITGDMPIGVYAYLRYALNERPDVVGIISGLVSADWYRQRLPVFLDRAATLGGKEQEISNETALYRMIEELERRQFKIYCNQPIQNLKGQVDRIGLLLRYHRKGPGLSPEELMLENQKAFRLLESSPRRGPSKMDWRQNFWIRYSLEQYIAAYQEIARSLIDLDKPMAIEAINKVIALEPRPRLESYLNRAGLYLKSKAYTEAAQDYQFCLGLDPQSRIALQGLIQCYQEQGNAEMASRYQQRLQALPPEK